MVNVLILENEPVYQQEISRIVRSVIEDVCVRVLDRAPSGLSWIPDIAIVDIALNGKEDGIHFMNEYGPKIPAILFYSVCIRRIKEAFGQNVLGFIEKGEEKTILKEKLLQALQILSGLPKVWLLDENGRQVPVRADLVCSCSRTNRIFWITDLSGNRLRTRSGRLEGCKSWIDDHFVWINQSEIINIHQICSVDGDEITLCNGQRLYMSRRYRRAALRRICQ